MTTLPLRKLATSAASLCVLALAGGAVNAQEQLPWGQSERPRVVQPGDGGAGGFPQQYGQRDERSYGAPPPAAPYDDRDRPDDGPPPYNPRYKPATPVYPAEPARPPYDERYGGRDAGPGRPYEAPPPYAGNREPYSPPPYDRGDQSADATYSPGEISRAGHRFFGRISSGLASVIEYAFQRGGRPNGYILGEEGGGAFIAGLRYGEGTLHMKNGYTQKVYWQGPSVGYDFGAEGSKSMILVYGLNHPGAIYSTFGGVSGSAYLVGGVGITFMKSDEATLAPIRSGIGLRLGANLGYLKYTRAPTWNPF